MVVLFRGETLPGTKLDVYTWEDKNDDKIVYFKIKRNEDLKGTHTFSKKLR